ncbi:hypothetical protein [Nonomuraea fuscirosea]|uniref:hypothetical protein n=1 Tax=Nonomuraea fuscirosea TaxID=1291556 RepID=UPI00343C86CA
MLAQGEQQLHDLLAGVKLPAATRLGTGTLTALTAAQRQAYLSDLAGLTRLRRESEANPLVALLVDAAVAHIKADLEVVESAERRLAGLAEQAPGVMLVESEHGQVG